MSFKRKSRWKRTWRRKQAVADGNYWDGIPQSLDAGHIARLQRPDRLGHAGAVDKNHHRPARLAAAGGDVNGVAVNLDVHRRSGLVRRVQGQSQVVDDIARILQADGQAHHVGADAGRLQLLLADLQMGGGAGMDDEGFCATDGRPSALSS